MSTYSGIERRGIASVIDGWKLFNTPYYSVWYGTELRFVNDSSDDAIAEKLLQDNLEALEASGNFNIYKLKAHKTFKEEQGITNKTPICGSFNFVVNDKGSTVTSDVVAINATTSASSKSFELLTKINERLERLEADKAAAEAAEADMEEEEEEDNDSIGEVINGMQRIEKAIQDSPLFSGLYDDVRLFLKFGTRKLMKGMGIDYSAEHSQMAGTHTRTQQQQHNNMSNAQARELTTEEKQSLTNSITTLLAHDSDLIKDLAMLANLASTDTDTFNLAIKKLRQLC